MTLPPLSLPAVTETGTNEINFSTYLSQKKVILFGLPGAFTPVCSSAHVPGFLKHAEAFFENGIDEILCLTVNDAFVLRAWAKDLQSGTKITFLADGSGALSEALEMALDLHHVNMGKRCQRFVMVIDHGVITHSAVEDTASTCALSSAEAVLKTLHIS